MNPENEIRMFVLLRDDMPYVDKLIYSNNVVADYILHNPLKIPFYRDCHGRDSHQIVDSHGRSMDRYEDVHIGKYFKWNKKIIFLSVSDGEILDHWAHKLVSWRVRFSQDFSDDGQLSAISCLGFKGDFKNVKTLKMPKGLFSSLFK